MVHRRPVAVVPPDPLAPLDVVVRGTDLRFLTVDVEEPVIGVAVAVLLGNALDRVDEAAAVAGLDLRLAFEHPHDGVRFGCGDRALQHRHGAIFPRHRQMHVADVGTGTEAAAGGREQR